GEEHFVVADEDGSGKALVDLTDGRTGLAARRAQIERELRPRLGRVADPEDPGERALRIEAFGRTRGVVRIEVVPPGQDEEQIGPERPNVLVEAIADVARLMPGDPGIDHLDSCPALGPMLESRLDEGLIREGEPWPEGDRVAKRNDPERLPGLHDGGLRPAKAE